jgi:hypothetical protein
MKTARIALLVVGIAAVLVGLIWMGQGSGYFPYPRSSFMIDQTPWLYRGTALFVVGLMALVASGRSPR